MTKTDSGPDPGPGRASAHPLLHRVDLVIALVILGICAALYGVTAGFEEVSALLSQNIPPEFFPRLVLLLIAILALGLPFEHLFHRRLGRDVDSDRRRRLQRMPYLTAALLVALGAAMPYLGTLLTMVAVCALLPPLWGERRLKLILPFAILFPLTVALVFNRILLVYFEPGVLGISF